MIRIFSFLLISFLLFSEDLNSNESDSLECRSGKPEVFFITPSQNIISSTGIINLEFGIKNFNISPAGQMACDSGHHHLLINVPLPDLTRPIISDENHIHYGKGQTSDTIVLPKGIHRLRLVLGNFAHIPHDEPIISEELIVEVR
mgnify:FL=1